MNEWRLRFVLSLHLYRSRLGETFMFAALKGWLVIHSLPYSGILIHYSIYRGFSKANESAIRLSSKLHLLYRCGLWTLRFLSCTSFVNLHSPSNSFTINALRVNEWRLQISYMPSPSYFQEAEILTKSMGVLIISTCSVTQMNCMCWQTQTIRFIKTYS